VASDSAKLFFLSHILKDTIVSEVAKNILGVGGGDQFEQLVLFVGYLDKMPWLEKI
jgi:hypothetical protein